VEIAKLSAEGHELQGEQTDDHHECGYDDQRPFFPSCHLAKTPEAP
jgi:hypothetical protein